MPAMMVLPASRSTSWIPACSRCTRRQRSASCRGSAFGILAAAIVAHISIIARLLSTSRRWKWGRAPTRSGADARGNYVNAALSALEQRMKPNDTLAVLPERCDDQLSSPAQADTPGATSTTCRPSSSCSARRRCSAIFEAHPPDWIVLAHKSTAGIRPAVLRAGLWAPASWTWITAHYVIESSFGDPPLQKGSPLLECGS